LWMTSRTRSGLVKVTLRDRGHVHALGG
jgi:hypothetical protein